ncbi:MAG: GNAT family N-acetyltransferase [Chloroflexi bacterium]|nr:GNAT family N-acetyltransferase [Chloroflexota bacterium]
MTTSTPRVVARGTLVRLREKQAEDARRDYEWRKDSELAAYDATRPITMTFRVFATTLTEDLRRPSTYRRTYAIEDLGSARHIGNVMYYGYDSLLREAELGITIGDRDYWAKGYGTDAVRVLLALIFETLDLRRVYLHTLTSNIRAQRAFRRAGFRRVRSLRRDGYDFERMEILREDFEVEPDAAAEAEA